MPHINLPEGMPGIRSLVAYRKDTGGLLYELAESLLRNDSPIPPEEYYFRSMLSIWYL